MFNLTKSFYNNFLVHIAVISIPFLSFINTNAHELDFVVLRSILIIFLATILLTFFFAKFISIVLKKSDHGTIHFVLAVAFFLLFFFHAFLKDIIHIINPILKGDISFILIILIFILFNLFFFYLKNNLIIRFVLVYLSLCFLFNLSIFLVNSFNIFSQDTSSSKNFFNQGELKNISQNDNKNIYYIVIDSALPLKIFDKIYQTNYYTRLSNEFNDLGYSIIPNVKSSYQDTKYTFAAIINLSYYINKDNYRSVPTTNLYPRILSKRNAGGMPLITTLNKIGYEFKWIGPYNKNCKLYNPDFCLNSKTRNSGIDNLISYYVLQTFIDRSPVRLLYVKLNNFFFKPKQEIIKIEYLHAENDGIGRFLEMIKKYKWKNKPHLFFIHNQVPHKPFIFNSDCSLNTKKYKYNSALGYKKNYECAIKRVGEVINYINQNDSEAIVIIQSDHSKPHDSFIGLNVKPTFSRYDIFSLIKVNKECKKYLSNKLDQVNAIRLALSCSTNQKVKLLDKKSYAVSFEIGGPSIGGKFSLKEIKTLEDELTFEEGFNSK